MFLPLHSSLVWCLNLKPKIDPFSFTPEIDSKHKLILVTFDFITFTKPYRMRLMMQLEMDMLVLHVQYCSLHLIHFIPMHGASIVGFSARAR